VPDELRTRRLILRRWRATDAAELQPVLAANVEHLKPWIPWRVAEPVDVDRLAERLAGFSAAFDDAREWRYGMFAIDTSAVLGEVSLFPRSAKGRVSLDAADEIEIGYWIRADATGKGLATEASRAAMNLALGLAGIARLTIRCDERNAASAAIPRRLGLRLADVRAESTGRIQIWAYELWSLPAAPPRATLDANSREESGHE
jgi:RimJ/RimL family protein N-acetyltransferase